MRRKAHRRRCGMMNAAARRLRRFLQSVLGSLRSFWRCGIAAAGLRGRGRRPSPGARRRRLAQRRPAEIPAAARRLCRGDFRSARARRHHLGAEPAHRHLLRRMVRRRQPEARDRLDDGVGCQFGARLRRSARGSAALLRRPHLDQRRHRILHGAIRARALFGQAPHHRRVGRRHQQFRPRCRHGARRGR